MNAFNLFYKHYINYKANKTIIKPFLLVGNDFSEPLIIELDYDYKNIDIFQSNNQSIGYVVAKYSIGYDFNKMDIKFNSKNSIKLSFNNV